jgi:hypothetical protein
VVVDGEVASGGLDLAGFPEQPVVPDAGGEGEYSLANACPDALGDVAAVVLEGELALERVVDRLDPLADPAELAEAWLLVLRSGRMSCASSEAMIPSNSSPAKPLSAMMISSPVSSPSRRAFSSIAAATSRSPSFAGARQKEIGIPSGEQSRYSRRPQK